MSKERWQAHVEARNTVSMKIHQVKTRLVNSYVIEYSDSLFVMDVAEKCHRYVLGFVEQTLQRPISDIKLVACSHDDFDHYGGVAALASYCDAAIALPYASASMRKKLLNNPSMLLFLPVTGLREALRPRAWDMYLNPKRNRSAKKRPKLTAANALAKPVTKGKSDYRLKHKARLPGFSDWEALHTPGHTWDSCCYYHAKSGGLLSGDTLLGSGGKGRAVAPSIYSNPRQMRITLRKLKRLNIKTVYPGHGSIIDLGS